MSFGESSSIFSQWIENDWGLPLRNTTSKSQNCIEIWKSKFPFQSEYEQAFSFPYMLLRFILWLSFLEALKSRFTMGLYFQLVFFGKLSIILGLARTVDNGTDIILRFITSWFQQCPFCNLEYRYSFLYEGGICESEVMSSYLH